MRKLGDTTCGHRTPSQTAEMGQASRLFQPHVDLLTAMTLALGGLLGQEGVNQNVIAWAVEALDTKMGYLSKLFLPSRALPLPNRF